MRYALLLYLDPETAQGTTREEAEAELAAYARITRQLAADGVLRGGEAFMPARTATVVASSERSAEPPAVAELELSGFYLVECDESQAIDIAARMPVAAHGAVEVRPLMGPPTGGGVTIPILASRSFDDTAGFYRPLGFAEVRRWPGEYLILRRHHDIELHFAFDANLDPTTNTAACYVRLRSAEQARGLHAEWAAVGPPGGRLHEPTATDYAMTEFALVDPDGNLLRIGAPTGD